MMEKGFFGTAGVGIDPSVRRAALFARLWYAPLIALPVFGMLYADSRFLVPGDAPATMSKILEGEWLYRLCIAGNLAGQVSQIFVMLALYRMFVSVDRDRARSLFAFVVVMVPVAFINSLNRFAPLVLLGNPEFLDAFGPGGVRSLGMLFLELEKFGSSVVHVFWGLWLVPLGILVYKSGWFPRVLGILLFVGCAGYLLNSLAVFVPAAVGPILKTIGNVLAIGELPFVLRFLVFGVRVRTGETAGGKR